MHRQKQNNQHTKPIIRRGKASRKRKDEERKTHDQQTLKSYSDVNEDDMEHSVSNQKI